MPKSLFSVSKMFNSTIRIQIIAALSVEPLTYKQLKKICQIHDGHLQTHLRTLIANEYLTSTVEIWGGAKQTKYQLTEHARNDFNEFMEILESTLNPETEEENQQNEKSKTTEIKFEG